MYQPISEQRYSLFRTEVIYGLAFSFIMLICYKVATGVTKIDLK